MAAPYVPINKKSDFPDWLYNLRLDLGMSVYQMATELQMYPNTIINWEYGYHHPRPKMWPRLLITLTVLAMERDALIPQPETQESNKEVTAVS